MSAFARDILAYKYYEAFSGGKKDQAEILLLKEKSKAPSKFDY